MVSHEATHCLLSDALQLAKAMGNYQQCLDRQALSWMFLLISSIFPGLLSFKRDLENPHLLQALHFLPG